MNTRNYARRGVGCASEYPRAEHDLYTTDPLAIRLLNKKQLLDKNTKYWECACGDGALSEELIKYGYEVYSSDLYDYGYGDKNIDFLKCTKPFDGDIITNPPFKDLTEFILKGLELCNKRLYILAGYKHWNLIKDMNISSKIILQCMCCLLLKGFPAIRMVIKLVDRVLLHMLGMYGIKNIMEIVWWIG